MTSHSFGSEENDAESGSKASSIYATYSSDNDNMDFEKGYNYCSTSTARREKISRDEEVGIIINALIVDAVRYQSYHCFL